MSGSDSQFDSLLSRQRTLERRESQLWWIAITVILILAIGVTVMDLADSIRMSSDSPLAAFNSKVIRYGLMAATILLCAYFRDSARRLRRWNSQLLTDLAQQTKLLERRNSELSRLKSISDHLAGNADLEAGLDMLLSSALHMAGAESASILLVDEKTGKLDRFSARTMRSGGKVTSRADVHKPLAELVAEQGQPVMVNAEDMPAGHEQRGGVPMVLAPISVGGKVLGIISVRGRSAEDEFTEEDLNSVSTLADQAGIAIEKMHLYQRLQEQVVSLRSALRDLKQAQTGLIQSEKLASIGQLAGGMAHEINNPLLVILGRAELLLMDTEPGNPKARDLEIIRSETERIAGLVRNLLSFSRVARPGVLSMVNVNDIIERTLQLVETHCASGKITVIRRLAASLPAVLIEAGELQQVYMNIALNAIQAMKETGGRLVVETSQDDAGNVVAKLADSGPGIAPEILSKIFDPFFTTKSEREGTGLGLSVSREIVDKYGGRIEVQTREREGATFIVKLPAAEPSIADASKAA